MGVCLLRLWHIAIAFVFLFRSFAAAALAAWLRANRTHDSRNIARCLLLCVLVGAQAFVYGYL